MQPSVPTLGAPSALIGFILACILGTLHLCGEGIFRDFTRVSIFQSRNSSTCVAVMPLGFPSTRAHGASWGCIKRKLFTGLGAGLQ